MRTLQTFIDDQQGKVESLEVSVSNAYWNATLTGSKEDEDRAAALVADLQTQYSSAADLAFLKSIPTPADVDLARQKQILTDNFLSNQSTAEVIREISAREMEIETLFSNFRANLDGRQVTDNELSEVFKKSNSSEERLLAWKASKQIGAVAEPKVLELVNLRNREARRLGFSNYYSMRIALQELDEKELFKILEDVAEQLRPIFTAYKVDLDVNLAERFGVKPEHLKPWHYSDPFFQSAPEVPENPVDRYLEGKNLEEIASNFFSAIGFDIDRLLRISDLYEKPGKMQHAYCTAVGRGTHDVRVLCNLVSNSRWMGTLLHEFGHAVYDDLVDENLPFFLRTVTHTMTTEAIAEMMGRFVDSGEWLQLYVGVPEHEAEAISAQASNSHRAHMLIFTQWVLVMSMFERELYNNPDQDLDKLWWSLVERYQQVNRTDFTLKGVWASKIHLASTPVYYHNYLLGEMTASQLIAAMKHDVLHSGEQLIDSPKVGRWLTEKIFRHGARYSWNDLLKRATGEPLDPQRFIGELV